MLRDNPDGYIERHHKIPKSLGGSDDAYNLVLLTAKEHYTAHHLLTKMCISGEDKRKMWSAFFFMHTNPSNTGKRYYTGRSYEIAKKHMAEGKRKYFSGKNNAMYGRRATDETKGKMSKNWNREAPRNMDKRIYTFTHDKYGTERCTRKELCVKYDISHKRIYTIVKKKANTTKGWRILWENTATLNENQEIFTKHQ